MRWFGELRSVFTWGVIFIGMALPVAAAPPSVVFTIKSIDDILDDADSIGETLGFPGSKETAEQFLNNMTGGIGLSGFDREKPLGAYWTIPDDFPSDVGNPVVFFPLGDVDALKKVIKIFVPNMKEKGDQWEIAVQGQLLIGRVVDDYFYLSNSASVLKDVPSPDKIVNPDYDVALDINLDSIPRKLKQTFLETTEKEGRKSLANGPPPSSEAEAAGQKIGFDLTLATMKSIINDGNKLAIGFNLDDDNPLASFEVALTAKPSTPLEKTLAVYAKTPPAFGAVASEAPPLRAGFAFPTTGFNEYVDPLFDAMKKSADESIAKDDSLKDDADKAAAKDVSKRLFGIMQSTIKSGSLNSIIVLEDGDKDTIRVIVGAKVAKGDEAGKLLDDIVKLSKESPDYAKLKTDVDKHAGARIHSVEGDFDDKQAALFGDNPTHIAIRADSLWFSLGGGNLGALKTALEASGKTSSKGGAPISIQMKPAKLITLLEQNDEALVQRAEGLAGEPGDVFNIEILPTEKSGVKLRVEFGIELAKLGMDR